MKTTRVVMIVAALLVAVVQTSFANDDKYIETMQKNIDAIYKAQTIEQFQEVINTLTRIASVEKTKWEPHYYIAFGYVMMSRKESDSAKKDQDLDLAAEANAKAAELLPEDSEIVTMEGFINMMRLTVDPSTRGPRYAPLASQLFAKAITLNPENPRAHALNAQMQYGSAQFFGSPTTEACASLAKALEKFDTFKPANPIAPMWGKRMAEGMKEMCK